MLDENKILINDSCVLFDLLDLNLLHEFFQLEYNFSTSPHVIGEITDNSQMIEISKYIQNQKLVIDSNGLLENIQVIFDKFQGLSLADSSVLEMASRINGILLSSDKLLRNISKKKNLEVRGVLWIIKELVQQKIIAKEIAVQKLQDYPKFNIRIPIKEIRKLFTELQNGQ